MSFITNAEGNFFVQEDKDEPFEWLTCTGVGDIELPGDSRTPVYDQNPLASGQFEIAGFITSPGGAGTYSLDKPLLSSWNFLTGLKCPFVGRVNWVCRGNRQDPRNYQVGVILHDSAPDRRRIENPASGGGEGDTNETRVMTAADLTFAGYQMLYRISASRVTVTNTVDAHDVYFMPEMCGDKCGDPFGLCKYGLMGLEGAAGYLYEGELKKTEDGSTWEEITVDPFTYSGATSRVLILDNVEGPQFLVFRGEAVVGAPAECAISDDEGVTWTNVEIGSINGQYVNDYAFNGANLFVVTNGGYIYRSQDFGATWEAMDEGDATSEDLTAIAFTSDNVGIAVGDGNAFVYSEDGGTSWSAGTGPAAGENLLAVDINRFDHIYVTTNSATIYRSKDDGDSWESVLELSGGTIDWIQFDPEYEYIGAMIWNNASGRGYLYRSADGGNTWDRVQGMPNNSGLNGGHICDANHIQVVGDAHDGTTFIAKTAIRE